VANEDNSMFDKFMYDQLFGRVYYFENGTTGKFSIINRIDKDRLTPSYVINGKIFNKTTLDISEVTVSNLIDDQYQKVVLYNNK